MTDKAKNDVVTEKEPQPLSEEEMEKITGGIIPGPGPTPGQEADYGGESHTSGGNGGE